MSFTDKQINDLGKKLDPKNIKPAPRGKFGDYIDGHHVISEANRIFGFDGWSYEVTRMEKVSEQTVTLQGSKGAYEQFRVGYFASVRVDVGGVIREGVAVGSGSGKLESIADHHESAVKEAETDALKRALRTFGNQFGLALYDKTKRNVGVDEPEPAPIPTQEDLLESVERAKSDIQAFENVVDTKEWFEKTLTAWKEKGFTKDQRAELVGMTADKIDAIKAVQNSTLMAG